MGNSSPLSIIENIKLSSTSLSEIDSDLSTSQFNKKECFKDFINDFILKDDYEHNDKIKELFLKFQETSRLAVDCPDDLKIKMAIMLLCKKESDEDDMELFKSNMKEKTNLIIEKDSTDYVKIDSLIDYLKNFVLLITKLMDETYKEIDSNYKPEKNIFSKADETSAGEFLRDYFEEKLNDQIDDFDVSKKYEMDIVFDKIIRPFMDKKTWEEIVEKYGKKLEESSGKEGSTVKSDSGY